MFLKIIIRNCLPFIIRHAQQSTKCLENQGSSFQSFWILKVLGSSFQRHPQNKTLISDISFLNLWKREALKQVSRRDSDMQIVLNEKLPTTDFLIYLAIRLCRRRPIVKKLCSANYHYMTHDIFIVKTRTNKHKQADVLLYVNNGCGLNNCYSIKCNKQQEKCLCFKGKDMYFRWRRQNRDRTGLDHGLDHGSDHRKKKF